jgi:hypothetical protein
MKERYGRYECRYMDRRRRRAWTAAKPHKHVGHARWQRWYVKTCGSARSDFEISPKIQHTKHNRSKFGRRLLCQVHSTGGNLTYRIQQHHGTLQSLCRSIDPISAMGGPVRTAMGVPPAVSKTERRRLENKCRGITHSQRGGFAV